MPTGKTLGIGPQTYINITVPFGLPAGAWASAEGVAIPAWVGDEVTGDKQYAMSMLTTEKARQKAWLKAYGS